MTIKLDSIVRKIFVSVSGTFFPDCEFALLHVWMGFCFGLNKRIANFTYIIFKVFLMFYVKRSRADQKLFGPKNVYLCIWCGECVRASHFLVLFQTCEAKASCWLQKCIGGPLPFNATRVSVPSKWFSFFRACVSVRVFSGVVVVVILLHGLAVYARA